MVRKSFIAPLLAASAISLTASPALAGKADRARQAIAAAEAKIHAADMMGAGRAMPHEAADARAALAHAREDLSAGHKEDSINEAIHAQRLADTALGLMQHRQDAAMAAEREAHSEDVAAAQDQAAAAREQAADASARAEAAQQQAANSAADANAARNEAMMAAQQAQQPAQVDTTVTTQQATSTPHRTIARRHVSRRTTTTRHSSAPAVATTTTTVNTAVN
jgi:hypothetical protein